MSGDCVRVEWPGILSRDREGLSSWLTTRKADSDRRMMEREDSVTLRDTWIVREEALPPMDRVPLPLSEEILTLPIETKKEIVSHSAGVLDEVRMGLLRAWGGKVIAWGGKVISPDDSEEIQILSLETQKIIPEIGNVLEEIKMGLLKAWKEDEKRDKIEEKFPGNDVKVEDFDIIKKDKAASPTVGDQMMSLWNSWEDYTMENMDTIVEIVGPNLAEELRSTLMSAWDGTEVLEDLKVEDYPEKEVVKEVSIVEDLRRFLSSITQDDEEDQYWITVDEAMDDTASIVTLDDIDDINELPDSFSDLSLWVCRFI